MERCTDKQALFDFLSADADLHLYAIGDLDEPFWSNSTYWIQQDQGQIQALVLVYQMGDLPVVMALGSANTAMLDLLKQLIPELPTRIYAHISHGLEDCFSARYRCTYHETQLRMIQTRTIAPELTDVTPVWLDSQQADVVTEFYQRCYPENWFDPAMLSVHPFAGLTKNGVLISAAGIHTLSHTFGSAALGSITTDPDFRGRGYGRWVTGMLCERLRKTCPHIGLNVHADNAAAQRSYANAGFEVTARFSEMMLETEPSSISNPVTI